tara:strand:- start:164 stop:691 length:528 start_codon:yes stop_codon:yes gene_type:complete
MVKLYKDVLDNRQTEIIEEIMLISKQFPWYFARHNLYPDNQENHASDCFNFTHNFFVNGQPSSDFFYLVEPIVKYIKKQYNNIESILRIKANLYTNQHMNVEYDEHIDQIHLGEKECLVGLFNVTSCNGGTVVNKRKYPSVSNQLLIFDNVSHYGITQTNTQTRMCINFNFKKIV